MSFHLHVLNLRGDATNLDIRQLFAGMAIQNDGVIIVGGPKGEAFVTFDTESDLLRAMQMDGEQHLNFKIATDIDRLRGLNRMCTANLQKLGETDSVFTACKGSSDTNCPNVQTKRQRANMGEWGKSSKSVDPSDSDGSYPYDSKRRRTDGNSHIDSSFGKQHPVECAESYCLPKMEQPPWISSQHQIKPGGSSSPKTTLVPTPNQLQEGSVYSSNLRPMELPYPPSQRPHPDDHPLPTGPYPPPARPFSPPARPFSPPAGPHSPSVGPHPSPRRPFPPPGGPHPPRWGPHPPPGEPYPPPAEPFPHPVTPSPMGPRYPYNPGFQAGMRFNPAAPGPMSELKTVPKPSGIRVEGSLLMSLLPTSAQQKYCIQLSELPPDVTANLVWSWVGGPEGVTLGVILLKPTNDYAVAFLIYDNQFYRDQRLEFSQINAEKCSMADACDFITNFIYNWTKWKGPRRENSPIFETTLSGREKYVDHRTFYDFAKKSLTPPGELNKDPAAKSLNKDPVAKSLNKDPVATSLKDPVAKSLNKDPVAKSLKDPVAKSLNKAPVAKSVKKSSILPPKPNAEPFAKNVLVPEETKKSPAQEPRITKPDSEKFLVIYQLEPTITATEVHSWFSDGLSTLKLNFPYKNGPMDSEAMAFVLFANVAAYNKAVSEINNEKVVSFAQRTCRGSYHMIRNYGNKCTITEASSTGDRIISPEERQRPPFSVEYNQFSLVDSLNVRYSCLKAISYSITSESVWTWFPDAKGIVILKFMDRRLVVLIAFSLLNSTMKRGKGKFGNPKMQIKSLTHMTTLEAMKRHFSCAEIKISTGRKRPDRKITAEEAKFIISQLPHLAAPKSEIVIDKSKATPEENASFLYHLNSVDSAGGNEALYLMLYDMKRTITACDIHALFPDALCALKVNFDGDSFGPRKGIGYLLFKDVQGRFAAKLLFDQHTEKWMNPKKVPGFISKRSNRFKALTRQSMKQSLARMCPKSTISESSLSGVDRVLSVEELPMTTIDSSFLTAHDPPCLHYAQLTGFHDERSAGEIWDCLGGRTHSDIKGVVLLISKTDLKGCVAFVAFSAIENRDKMADSNEQQFIMKWWPTVLKRTERQVLGFLSGSTDDYIIKVSTDAGPDRDLDPAEQEHLGITNKMESVLKEAASPNRDLDLTEQEHLGITTKMEPILKKNAGMAASKPTGSKDIIHHFYIRLKKVPADVATACELLLMYTSEAGQARSATLVRDCDGVNESAYVMFDEEKHRDSALSVHPSSIRCTAQGRAVRLAEFEPDYQILESTESGEDRIMSVEERDGLEEAAQSMEISSCKVK